ncbi:hypothetical protein FJQ54_11010 [Sandaracinobacter neustonicus]|uniref:Porin n=1 Tax=Sandaracinobacter neustonicus TaxID=1715348 RepID=A0A501XJP8_9SPHN|nr:hypothetical protein [Sandaracinobacter neustonicus]TPE60523.1 hypothetical protein FJQ54_11010 [Sandaracinobacter neustonicus]
MSPARGVKRLVASFAGAALLCVSAGFGGLASSALAATAKTRLVPEVTTENSTAGFRTRSQALVLQPINLDVSKFAFTAPGRVASSKVQTVERSFSFTPSGNPKGVSVGGSVRSVQTAAADRSGDAGLSPAGYNFDLSVGYRGVQLSGGMSRVDGGIGGRSRQGMDVGVGYGARNWQAAIQASAERDSNQLIPRTATPDPRYSVEASGALALSPRVSVGGSLRYRLAPEHPTPLDPDKDDRAVMLGGAVAF